MRTGKIPREDDFACSMALSFFGMKMTANFVAKKRLPPAIQLYRYPPDRKRLQASNKSFSSFAHPLTIWSPLQHLTDFRIGLETWLMLPQTLSKPRQASPGPTANRPAFHAPAQSAPV